MSSATRWQRDQRSGNVGRRINEDVKADQRRENRDALARLGRKRFGHGPLSPTLSISSSH